MRCSKCGSILPEGSLFCNMCGKDIQIVSEVPILEDEILEAFVGKEDREPITDPNAFVDEDDSAAVEEDRRRLEEQQLRRRLRQEEKRKKKQILICIIILAAAILAIILIAVNKRMHSTAHYLKKAQEASQEHYDNMAYNYLMKVLEKEPENETALLLLAETYRNMGELTEAEDTYLNIIAMNPNQKEAYRELLEMYEQSKSYDKIVALYEKVTSDDIRILFVPYLIDPPTISVESGSFEAFFEVTISAPDDSLDIYYTLDGTKPTRSSLKYEDPVKIEQEGRTILTAVCMNRTGSYSETVSAVYDVKLTVPPEPEVSPNGGEFTQESKIYISVPSGCSVYYSWTNSTPDEESNLYSGPISVKEGNNVLYVVAIGENVVSSKVVKCNFVYYPEVEDDEEDGSKIEQDQMPSQDVLNSAEIQIPDSSQTEDDQPLNTDENAQQGQSGQNNQTDQSSQNSQGAAPTQDSQSGQQTQEPSQNQAAEPEE